VPVTEYVVVVVGLTVMLLAVAPLFHTYELAPVTVSVAEAPAHIDDADALTLRVGAALTVIVLDIVAEQPELFVPVQL
jgi:hypothetical protein